jgi:hypothetical protein
MARAAATKTTCGGLGRGPTRTTWDRDTDETAAGNRESTGSLPAVLSITTATEREPRYYTQHPTLPTPSTRQHHVPSKATLEGRHAADSHRHRVGGSANSTAVSRTPHPCRGMEEGP